MAKPAPQTPNDRVVCRNRRARHEFDLFDQLECGIALMGSEVKSIRNGKISIEEAYVRVMNNEVWLMNCDISEYKQASYMNHLARRNRKLLLKRREITKFAEAADQKGLTLVPLEVSFKSGFVKVTIAVAKGRKLHDKREAIKKRDDRKEMRSATLRGPGK